MRLRFPGLKSAPREQSVQTADAATAATPHASGVIAAPVTDGVTGTAASQAPVPDDGRGARLQAASRVLATAAAQFLLIAAAVVVLGYVLGKLWVILLPIVLGLLIATVLWPPVRFLRRHGWPPALAASVVVVVFLGAFGGLIAAIAPSVADQVVELGDQASGGLQDIQERLQAPPFNVDEEQLGDAIDSVINNIQGNAQNIASTAVSGASAVGSGLINLLLALLLCFFFLKDGTRWVPWLSAQTGPRAARHVAALSQKTWSTLSEFIRQQALVGFIDALFIGIGLWAFDVPLVLPLAVLTFFGAFIPIIGAFVAGAFAVLIALVDEGLTTALIILGIVLLVQQIEGNVLQPIIQGRGFNLHAGVVILAVTAGGSLAGITGAFLGVPVAALIAVIYRYVRDELDGNSPEVAPDGTRARLVEDESGAHLIREQVAEPEVSDDEASTSR
jgi:predicted PurR-regulated permease PerM